VLRPFWLALQFLSVLPAPAQPVPSPEEQGRPLLAYPLVGLLFGLLLLGLAALLAPLPPLLSAALLLAFWVVLSGALHLDGLADSADAWLGGHGSAARTLEIMKDPRSGPAGVVAVVLLLLLKFAALAEGGGWQALLLAPLLGRTALVLLFLTTPYVRPGGLGEGLARHLPRRSAGWMVGAVGLLVLLLAGGRGLLLLAVVAILFFTLRRMLLARIGGTTGDTAGAVTEITETVVLMSLVI